MKRTKRSASGRPWAYEEIVKPWTEADNVYSKADKMNIDRYGRTEVVEATRSDLRALARLIEQAAWRRRSDPRIASRGPRRAKDERKEPSHAEPRA